MRVISQDGTIDVPYEQVIIQRFETEIYFINKNLTGVEYSDDMEIASYSKEAKAKKAMEILQNTYYEHESEKIYKEGANYIHPYFRFPKDEDMEI